MEQEKKIWKLAWRLPASLKKLCGETALVMPFVQPCPDDQKANEDVKAAVKQAIMQLASTGYCHGDLHWRHVGLFTTKKGELAALLFDLSNVIHIKGKGFEVLETAQNKMLEALNVA